MKIVHITSSHRRNDTRIFIKECISLVNVYDVHFIVADGLGDDFINNIKIYDIGKPNNKFYSLFKTTNCIFKKAININADLYHLHDPELLIIVKKFYKKGKRVVFDMHEDVKFQIKTKTYLNKFFKFFVFICFYFFENYYMRYLNGVVFVQEFLKNRYIKYKSFKRVVVQNYEIINDFSKIKKNLINFPIIICYAGAITYSRGITNIFNLAKNLSSDYEIHLAGPIENKELEKKIFFFKGNCKLFYHGNMTRSNLYELYYNCQIGLILFKDIGQYHNSHAIKLFEYMSNGLFVIIPNFGTWNEFNKKNDNFAINVNTGNTFEIAKLINNISNKKYLFNINIGFKKLKEKYSWNSEFSKLIKFYEIIAER